MNQLVIGIILGQICFGTMATGIGNNQRVKLFKLNTLSQIGSFHLQPIEGSKITVCGCQKLGESISQCTMESENKTN